MLIAKWARDQPDNLLAPGRGYVAGVNRSLDMMGVSNLDSGNEDCRDAEWYWYSQWDLKADDVAVKEALLLALVQGVDRLLENNIALDKVWGEL